MQKIMVIGLLMVVYSSIYSGRDDDQLQDMGNSNFGKTSLDDQKPHRLIRSRSEVSIIVELQKEFELMKQEQEKKTKNEEEVSNKVNRLEKSLTNSFEENDNRAIEGLRINSFDIMAKLINIYKNMQQQQKDNKSMHDTVVNIHTDLKKIDKKFTNTRKCSAITIGALMTCQCLLLIFITVGISSLLST